ncbi:hypothetical protein WMZ97_20315 [Lentibacillus sp. N15]|uniref:hypothetical protein n=1 Tax=Lentibacillus songyuanensis TaxID=3136161 RepID=UPI0031B9FB8A
MRENIVAKILFVIGITIIVASVLMGIIVGLAGYGGQLGYTASTTGSILFFYFFTGIVVGMLFIGLSEIIHLLHGIYRKLHETGPEHQQQQEFSTNPIDMHPNNHTDTQMKRPSEMLTLTQMDQEKIIYLYPDEQIIEMIPANVENYCVVKMVGNDGLYFIRIVHLNGSEAMEATDQMVKKHIITWYNKRMHEFGNISS